MAVERAFHWRSFADQAILGKLQDSRPRAGSPKGWG